MLEGAESSGRLSETGDTERFGPKPALGEAAQQRLARLDELGAVLVVTVLMQRTEGDFMQGQSAPERRVGHCDTRPGSRPAARTCQCVGQPTH